MSGWTQCPPDRWITLWSAPTATGFVILWSQGAATVDYQYWGVNVPYTGEGRVELPAGGNVWLFVQAGPSAFAKVDVKPFIRPAFLRMT